MKKVIIAALAIAFFSGSAFAEEQFITEKEELFQHCGVKESVNGDIDVGCWGGKNFSSMDVRLHIEREDVIKFIKNSDGSYFIEYRDGLNIMQTTITPVLMSN